VTAFRRLYLAAIGLSVTLSIVDLAHAAHYGTQPATDPPLAPTLSITDHPPRCIDSKVMCRETSGNVRAFTVADGDRIALDWTNDTQELHGLIRLRHLYLPLDGLARPPDGAVTLEIVLPGGGAIPQVVVSYAGTRHHVPLQPGAWQALSIYDPDERVIYLRFDRRPSP
jgi:hypothetical protein